LVSSPVIVSRTSRKTKTKEKISVRGEREPPVWGERGRGETSDKRQGSFM